MKSFKTILLGTILTAGFGLIAGTSAQAESLYTVQAGDSLSKISQEIKGDNSLIQKIATDNNISDVNMIYAGQQLVINEDGGTTVVAAPAQSQPVVTEAAPAAAVQQAPAAEAYTGNSSSAKEWIAQKESSGSYGATNGRYIGRYQLDASYLNGDYSEANQERVADAYVAGRYGSWEAAQAFWLANGWY